MLPLSIGPITTLQHQCFNFQYQDANEWQDKFSLTHFLLQFCISCSKQVRPADRADHCTHLPALLMNPASASGASQSSQRKQFGCQLQFIALMTRPMMNSSSNTKTLVTLAVPCVSFSAYWHAQRSVVDDDGRTTTDDDDDDNHHNNNNNRFMPISPELHEWAGTRRNTHPPTHHPDHHSFTIYHDP